MTVITLQSSSAFSSSAFSESVALVKLELCWEKGEWKYKKAIGDSKVIEVALSCLKNEKKEWCWQVTGTVTLSDGLKNKKWTGDIDPFQIEASEGKCIGSWDGIFVRDGVSINIADSIPPEELGKLAHKTLITIRAYTNGVEVKSDKLDKIEKLVKEMPTGMAESTPTEELGKQAHQTLLTVRASTNGVKIQSDKLEEIKEQARECLKP